MTGPILVTGASGFVGGALVDHLLSGPGHEEVAIAVRRPGAASRSGVTEYVMDGLGPETDWSLPLTGASTVVHCAARVHVMHDHSADPLEEFRQVNVLGTLRLAEQAAAAGVQRLVFLSSVKVNGEATSSRRPFDADAMPAPLDAYGISKHEAECGLRELALRTGMQVVIIRPPLVYGPGVKGNFASMMRWVRRGVPLPLGAIDNRRSFVALANLVDLMHLCLSHPAAANQTFLVSDDQDVSTTELLRRLGIAMRRPARLLPVPPAILQVAAALAGKRAMAQRLCGDLQVDITKTRDLLGWRPPLTLDQGLQQAAEGMR